MSYFPVLFQVVRESKPGRIDYSGGSRWRLPTTAISTAPFTRTASTAPSGMSCGSDRRCSITPPADIAKLRAVMLEIDVTNDVTKYGNPLFTIMDPLPLLGADAPLVSIGFIAQLDGSEGRLLQRQHDSLAGRAGAAAQGAAVRRTFRGGAAIGCPSPRLVDRIPVGQAGPATGERGQTQKGPPTSCQARRIAYASTFSSSAMSSASSLPGRGDPRQSR